METKSRAKAYAFPPQSLIAAARGDVQADLVIRDIQVADLLLGRIYPADVAIKDGWICGIGPGYSGVKELDGQGAILAPGFMDAHTHLESTRLTPSSLARALLPLGTVAIICDPHEIANVAGVPGLEWMLRATEDLPVDFFFTAPSCVPATEFETSGASIEVEDIDRLLKHPRIIGLGEMMNYPGVINQEPDVMAKLETAAGLPVDGHAPMVTGKDLNAYMAAGIATDHECVRRNETREKVSRGMRVFIRQGASAKNLRDLASIVTEFNHRRFCMVTDDLSAEDLVKGHMDKLLRKAVDLGMPPLAALSLVSLNVAETYCLGHRGAVGVGWKADLVLLEDLTSFKVLATIKNGKIVAKYGKIRTEIPSSEVPDQLLHTVRLASGWEESLSVPAKSNGVIRVIRIVPGQIVTEAATAEPRIADGRVISDPDRDILKLVVLERHRASGRVGIGFVQGFELQQGAMASSVAHDSHNIIAVGATDGELIAAIRAVEQAGGGLALARGEDVLILPLPVAGLLSNWEIQEVAERSKELTQAVQELGCPLKRPFMQLSFLALPVIPALKLTDRGLFNVSEFSLVDLWA